MTHEESRIQQGCVRWFRYQFPNLARLLFAVPNGGARDRVTGAILKGEGVVAGVSDLILLVPAGPYHALCVEMKTRTGHQSASQKEWQAEVEKHGYRYVVCRSLDDFINAVYGYLGSNETRGKGIYQ